MLALARLPQEPPVARLYRLCRAAYRAQDYLLHQAPLLGAEMDRPYRNSGGDLHRSPGCNFVFMQLQGDTSRRTESPPEVLGLYG